MTKRGHTFSSVGRFSRLTYVMFLQHPIETLEMLACLLGKALSRGLTPGAEYISPLSKPADYGSVKKL